MEQSDNEAFACKSFAKIICNKRENSWKKSFLYATLGEANRENEFPLTGEVQYMIRRAVFDDIELIEDAYNEHFKYEMENGAFTVFKKGIYPTGKDAEKAIDAGTLYVYEDDSNIAGSIIVDKTQPAEYAGITWRRPLREDEVRVIHLLMVRPCMAGKGIGTSLVKYAVELAKNNSCKALRLDTGSQNIPAISLYKKSGFQIVAAASMNVGGTIEHREHLFMEKVL